MLLADDNPGLFCPIYRYKLCGKLDCLGILTRTQWSSSLTRLCYQGITLSRMRRSKHGQLPELLHTLGGFNC